MKLPITLAFLAVLLGSTPFALAQVAPEPEKKKADELARLLEKMSRRLDEIGAMQKKQAERLEALEMRFVRSIRPEEAGPPGQPPRPESGEVAQRRAAEAEQRCRALEEQVVRGRREADELRANIVELKRIVAAKEEELRDSWSWSEKARREGAPADKLQARVKELEGLLAREKERTIEQEKRRAGEAEAQRAKALAAEQRARAAVTQAAERAKAAKPTMDAALQAERERWAAQVESLKAQVAKMTALLEELMKKRGAEKPEKN